MTTAEPARCEGCRREIEACACCQQADCPDPICYRDLIYEIRQSILAPHTHGG